MTKNRLSENKPLIGFFPLFYNLAETGRAVLIAKRYKELGGQAVFFSHGGKYEYLAVDIGCKVVKVKPIYTEQFIEHLWKCSRLEEFGPPFSKEILIEHVEAEIDAYTKAGVKMIVSTNNFPCSISARAADIPLIFVTPRVIARFTKYPDDAEFFFTRFFPESWMLRVLNWYFPRAKSWVRPFNKVGRRYPNVPLFKRTSDLVEGDFTLFTDFIELLPVDESNVPANEHYIGPIFLDELFNKKIPQEKTIESMIDKHLQRPGRSILLTLGSSGTEEFYLEILEALNKTDYNIIAVYASILKEDELPSVNDNVLLVKFVPSIRDIHSRVDLAIIHGGQGTVYTAAYSGKPVIGFPMQFEQHLNLEMLVKQGMAFIASRKNFEEDDLLSMIDEIFSNYDTYLKNAEDLAQKLPEPEGDEIAVQKILEIIQK